MGLAAVCRFCLLPSAFCLLPFAFLLTSPPGRNRPHGFDHITAKRVNLIVQVDRWIAVRWHELEAVADPDIAVDVGEVEPAVLIAGPRIHGAGQVHSDGCERPIGAR